jgi:hypothetical protein
VRELTLAPAVDKLVRQVSRPTLARLLGPARAHYPRRGAPITRPGTVLKHEIPIRTFTEWNDARPGFLEVDLVAHCGSSPEGFYLCTLCAVEITTAWVELEPVWGKSQIRVGGAVDHVRTRLPMPLLGLDSDNGSEFIRVTLRVTLTCELRRRPHRQPPRVEAHGSGQVLHLLREGIGQPGELPHAHPHREPSVWAASSGTRGPS